MVRLVAVLLAAILLAAVSPALAGRGHGGGELLGHGGGELLQAR